jgi:thioesterase domain-containing protein
MENDAQKSGVVGVFPTSSPQTSFWYQEQLTPGSGTGNIAVRWEIRGKFRADNIERAVQTVIERHEVLRTRFIQIDGLPHQEVLERLDFKMDVVDIRGLPVEQHKARIDEIATKLASHPFDLTVAGLIRIALVRSAPDCAALLITAHHTVFDGFSIRILGREIGTLAAAYENDKPHDLADLPLQYGDFALWQEELLNSDAHAESSKYWAAELQNIPFFEVEPDFDVTDDTPQIGKRVDIAFPAEFGDRLTETARSMNTSPFTIGTAVAAATLQRFSGQTDISFGTATAGRNEVELEELIGVFINPVVLRFRTAQADTLEDIVAQGDKVVQGALAHSDYPFKDLMRDLKYKQSSARPPLVSVFFALQQVFLEEQSYGSFSIASVPSETPKITHDLNIQLLGRASGWLLMLDYDAERFQEKTVTKLGHLFRDTFMALLADPTTRISELPFTGREIVDAEPFETIAETPPRKQDAARSLRIVPPVPQTSSTQTGVAAIWSDVLGLPAQDCDGDFFDLGGHSILVLRMLSRIDAEFGVRIPLVGFLEDPTLSGVATSVDNALTTDTDDDSPANWEIINLKQGQKGAPIIVSVNQPFLYHNIARDFKDAYRVINLHISNERYFDAEAATTIQDIARDAAQKVESEAAGCPVILMGQCVDGLMCLSVAQMLEKTGVEVLNLAMIDSWEPNSGVHLSASTRKRRRFQGKLRRWKQYIRLKAQGEISWTDFFSKSSAMSRLLVMFGRLDAPTSTELQEIRINVQLTKMYKNHQFAPYKGAVTLFKTESHTNEAFTRGFGWGKTLSPDTPVYPLRGWHEDTLLWHGFDKVVEVIESHAHRFERLPDETRIAPKSSA